MWIDIKYFQFGWIGRVGFGSMTDGTRSFGVTVGLEFVDVREKGFWTIRVKGFGFDDDIVKLEHVVFTTRLRIVVGREFHLGRLSRLAVVGLSRWALHVVVLALIAIVRAEIVARVSGVVLVVLVARVVSPGIGVAIAPSMSIMEWTRIIRSWN